MRLSPRCSRQIRRSVQRCRKVQAQGLKRAARTSRSCFQHQMLSRAQHHKKGSPYYFLWKQPTNVKENMDDAKNYAQVKLHVEDDVKLKGKQEQPDSAI